MAATAGYTVTVTPAEVREAERAYEEARQVLGCGYPSDLTPQQKAGQVSGRNRKCEAARLRYKAARAKVEHHQADTLDKARKVAFEAVGNEANWGDLTVKLMELGESGGTVEIDGSTITVEAEMRTFVVTTANGSRSWRADDETHAREQHTDAFGGDAGEEILSVVEADREDGERA